MAFDLSPASATAELLPATVRPLPITVRLIEDAAEWEALVAAAPEPHLPQDYAYSVGKAATGWPARRVVFLAGERPVAFAVVLQMQRFGLKLLNRVNRGPIFLAADPSEEQIVAVYRALRRRFGRLWTLPLLIAPALHQGERSSRLLRAAGYRYRASSTWRPGGRRNSGQASARPFAIARVRLRRLEPS